MTMLTSRQAYVAMFAFLKQFYQLTGDDSVGGLLGSLSLLADGRPADPAMEQEWSEAVAAALAGKVDTNLH